MVNFYIQMDNAVWLVNFCKIVLQSSKFKVQWSHLAVGGRISYKVSVERKVGEQQNVAFLFQTLWPYFHYVTTMWEETACVHFAFRVALEQNRWNHLNSIVHLDIQVDYPNDYIYIWIYKLTIQMTAFTFGYTSWPSISKWLLLHLDIEVDHSNDCIYIWIYKLTSIFKGGGSSGCTVRFV